ncbi:endonuclease/exonuclease/phosphatase family protein [Thalassotalea aquiviva]|uniref:endonuclease/exonuclease/phosphatase family protein n=1 Tax=Thalassotalea aquiviva TaxID=3242415 RepID=UPI00352A7DC8
MSTSSVCKKLSQFFLGTFFLLFVATLTCWVLPWSKYWSLIEDLLLYMPRWLIWLPLVLSGVFYPSFFFQQRHKIVFVSLLILISYLDFQLPAYDLSTPERKPEALSLMSVNMGGGNYNPEIISEIAKNRPSIIAFQETPGQVARQLIPKNWYLHCRGQMCLGSMYNFTFVDGIARKSLGGWGNLGLLYQLKWQQRTLYIMNVHLETPRKGFEQFQWSKLNFRSLLESSENRFLEAKIVSNWAQLIAPLIIVGDFNMTVESSIYRNAFGRFNNAFSQLGFGFGRTKFTRFHGLRIDHILYDHSFQAVVANVGDNFGSDHKAVYAELIYNN